MSHRSTARLSLVAALVAASAGGRAGTTAAAEGVTDVGRRIYREGLLPSGERLTALVAGDVPISGAQLSCESCHGRSGMGAGEGAVVVPPVSKLLFETSAQGRRPAYDERTLARALREGVGSSGRRLAPLMPRYRLADADVAALADYLRGLSAAPSPGVSAQAIRFATVFSDDVPAETRRAMLDVLETYAADKTRQTRLESRRIGHGAPPGEKRPPTYRAWQIDVWELHGPASTWEVQLEARYRERPVFALLSGASGGSWGPIARFCERYQLPALLPSTDLPDLPPGAFYTLHFSRGLLLEADLLAIHLGEAIPPGGTPPRHVVQVYRKEGPGREAARRLAARLAERDTTVESLGIERWETRPLERLAHHVKAADTVLWLTRDDLVGIEGLGGAAKGVYLSSTLLERDLAWLPASGSSFTYAAHPFVLPGRSDPALRRFRAWLGRTGIALRDERRQAEAYFACMAANEALMHAGRFFVRDFVLDRLDHAQGLVAYLPLYPSPGAGPGQRFLGKGGYVLPLDGGRPQSERARWLVP